MIGNNTSVKTLTGQIEFDSKILTMTEIELVGNAFCLDVTNTVNSRIHTRHDWLGTAEQAITWARAAARPIDEPAAALEAGLPAMRAVRETVYRVIQPLTRGGNPPPADVAALTQLYGEAVGHAQLERAGDVFALSWSDPRTARSLRWEVAASALELLTHGPLHRLGECPSCGWLFLDISKNGRRRWCNMATCGSRDKARRYYATHTSK